MYVIKVVTRPWYMCTCNEKEYIKTSLHPSKALKITLPLSSMSYATNKLCPLFFFFF